MTTTGSNKTNPYTSYTFLVVLETNKQRTYHFCKCKNATEAQKLALKTHPFGYKLNHDMWIVPVPSQAQLKEAELKKYGTCHE